MITLLLVMLFIALAMIVITFVSFGVWVVIPALCIWGIYKCIKAWTKKQEKPDLVIMSRKDFNEKYELKKVEEKTETSTAS